MNRPKGRDIRSRMRIASKNALSIRDWRRVGPWTAAGGSISQLQIL
jgi:hypothetical protein